MPAFSSLQEEHQSLGEQRQVSRGLLLLELLFPEELYACVA